MISRLALPSSNNTNQPSSSSNLSSQPIPNPNGALSAITLRSRTTLEEIPARALEDIHEKEVVIEAPHEEEEMSTRQKEGEVNLKEPKRKATMDESIPIPFPSMIKKAKKASEFDLNMLQYARYLKDLCIHKDRIGELETLSFGSSISALMKPIPEKFGDPRPCLVSCRIGGVVFHDCMCDLGAYVSIMPFSVFARLNLAPLKRLTARFALADKGVITVMGIAEDVLVAIKDLVFSIDFYILEMPPTEGRSSSSVLLGRPFLKTSKFKLDAFTGTYSFEVGEKTIKFNLKEAMKHPPEEHSVLRCDVIDEVVAEVQSKDQNELCYPIVEEKDDQEGEQRKFVESDSHELGEKELQLEAKSELKPLPSHLKYAFLGDNQEFPIIIASELSSQEEEKVIEVLRKHKKAIDWSLGDIVGIDPHMCMHHIFLQEGARLVRQTQRRLNPTILDVVKKEVTRLLDAGFYRRFIKNFSNIALPLLRLLQKDTDFEFDSACAEAFEELKRALTTAPIVRGPDWTQPFEIMCDASNHAVCAALAQRDGSKIAVYMDHAALKDQSGSQNLVVDHLSRLENLKYDPFPINDSFPLDSLHAVSDSFLWFAPMVEAIPTRLDDANAVISFIRNNIVCRYGSPRAIDWSYRLGDALWAYRMAYKTPLGMSPFQVVYGKACHLPVEVEHKAYWVVKQCYGHHQGGCSPEIATGGS
ncbi:uncharacterized protein [Arachis hypogaea]|uniref:uncharacterized protein n=1 Tax=Arachis hypogaea TaxID=3818 RepID=UPI000DED024C|nr:uncharacterized protein LOC112718421 [Arachis hypogaea]